jgi:hypothetical protein
MSHNPDATRRIENRTFKPSERFEEMLADTEFEKSMQPSIQEQIEALNKEFSQREIMDKYKECYSKDAEDLLEEERSKLHERMDVLWYALTESNIGILEKEMIKA